MDITSEQTGGQCLIRVRDNGIGIETQYIEEIFKLSSSGCIPRANIREPAWPDPGTKRR